MSSDKMATDTLSPTLVKSNDYDEKRESIAPTEAPTVVEDEGRYLTGMRLFAVFTGMLMSILLIALDQTIVSAAELILRSSFVALGAYKTTRLQLLSQLSPVNLTLSIK
jgi:hypothetical protein